MPPAVLNSLPQYNTIVRKEKVMAVSFDQCTDACGWTAGIIAALSYGSFGVPIKHTAHIDVHPLVLQSYKTLVVFLSCWLVVLLDVNVAFTWWGILSGFMWVVGGTGGIYAIRKAGLAIAVGTWASVMVMVNFIFGILVFHEPIHDIWGTMGAFILLIVGLIGMSQFSAPHKSQKADTLLQDDTISYDDLETTSQSTESTDSDYQEIEQPHVQKHRQGNNEFNRTEENENGMISSKREQDNQIEDAYHVVLFGGRLSLTKRQCGIVGAVWNGFFTGGSLVPLHYAKEQGFGGANYMISMSCGAFISNLLIWIAIFLAKMRTHNNSTRETLKSMPECHFRQLAIPGFLAGILLSMAMFGSIISVTYLGQGVGNSLVQTKILVSGLWGILWFKEITGTSIVIKWFAAAVTTVVAIVWLSLERIMVGGGGGH